MYIISFKQSVLEEAIEYCARIENQTGFVLNAAKCKLHDLWEVKQGGARIDILGACIGSADMRKEFLKESIERTKNILARLKQLPKQHALLMLRQSTSNKLRYLLRCMELQDNVEQVKNIDVMFYDVVDFLRGVPSNERTNIETAIMGLPSNMGGFGIYSHRELRPLARRASVSASRNELIQRELSSKQLLVWNWRR